MQLSVDAIGKKVTLVFVFTILFYLLSLQRIQDASALPQFIQQIPAGYEQNCTTCHTQPPALNSLGQDFKKNGFSFQGLSKPSASGDGTSKPASGSSGGGKQDAEPKVELVLPGSVARGENTSLKAKITIGGKPTEGKKVEFFEETEFFIKGKVKLGEATSDSQGIAAIHYRPMELENKVTVTAVIAGEKTLGATASIALTSLGVSLEEAEEGFKVPFLGTWVIFVLVGAVWAIYAYVLYKTLQIPKKGKTILEQATSEADEQQYASL